MKPSAGTLKPHLALTLKTSNRTPAIADETIIDLIADLLLLADFKDYDPEAILESAQMHFEAESAELPEAPLNKEKVDYWLSRINKWREHDHCDSELDTCLKGCETEIECLRDILFPLGIKLLTAKGVETAQEGILRLIRDASEQAHSHGLHKHSKIG